MTKRPFGRTGLQVSPLGFGGAEVGFLDIEVERVTRILNLLLDHGVNLIDTAECYAGSEELIGRAVAHRRDEFFLVTKCGHAHADLQGEPWSATLIRASVERSLRRLRTDRLDVVLLHSCEQDVLRRGEALGELVKARDAGKIRFVGYSGDNETAAHAASLPDVAVIETSVNICDQANIALVLPAAQGHNCGVIAKRPIANSAWKRLSLFKRFYPSYAKPYAQRLHAMKLTPAALGFDGPPETVWPQIALRFTLSQSGVHTAIVGTTRVENAKANIAAAEQGPLPAEVVRKICGAFRAAEAESGETWPGLT